MTDYIDDDVVTVATPRCLHCKTSSDLIVRRTDYQKWVAGAYIQQAFPEMPHEIREQLISGTHPACWKEIFGDDD